MLFINTRQITYKDKYVNLHGKAEDKPKQHINVLGSSSILLLASKCKTDLSVLYQNTSSIAINIYVIFILYGNILFLVGIFVN